MTDTLARHIGSGSWHDRISVKKTLLRTPRVHNFRAATVAFHVFKKQKHRPLFLWDSISFFRIVTGNCDEKFKIDLLHEYSSKVNANYGRELQHTPPTTYKLYHYCDSITLEKNSTKNGAHNSIFADNSNHQHCSSCKAEQPKKQGV